MNKSLTTIYGGSLINFAGEKKKDSIPFVDASSTKITSKRLAGARFNALYAVRSNTEKCSLWNGTTILAVGRSSKYFCALQLLRTNYVYK